MPKPYRIPPLGQPGDYRTYSVLAPLTSHWRVASCAEVDCKVSASGWVTTVDEATRLGERQAGYLRNGAGRHYTERRDGPLTVFTFPPGEDCFTTHQIRSDREPIFAVRRGDWRSYGEATMYDRGTQWVDDFSEHQNQLERKLNG